MELVGEGPRVGLGEKRLYKSHKSDDVEKGGCVVMYGFVWYADSLFPFARFEFT